MTLATVLPMAWPALRRDNGAVLLGLQNDTASGDISRDLADTLQRALEAEPGTPVAAGRAAGRRPAAAGLLDPDAPFEPEVHSGFEFWVADAENATARSPPPWSAPTPPRSRPPGSPGVDAAYWCETPEKNHLRWVMPHPEEQLLDALARLHAAGASSLGEGTRLVGLVPRARPDGAGLGPAERDGRGGRARSPRRRSPSGWRRRSPRTRR